MCELLRLNYDKRDLNDSKSDPGLYEAGMYIVAQDDGWEWSATEKSSAYSIIKLPGIPKNHESIKRLLEPEEEELDWLPSDLLLPVELREPKLTKLKRRRKLKTKIDEFTKADEDYLADEKNTLSDRLVRIHTRCEDLTAASLEG